MGYKVHTVNGQMGEVATSFTETIRVPSATAGTYPLVKAPSACRIVAVRAYRTGGSAGTVQVTNGGDNVLSSAMATSTGAWAGTTTVQNSAVAVGGEVSVTLGTPGGSPTETLVQVDFAGA